MLFNQEFEISLGRINAQADLPKRLRAVIMQEALQDIRAMQLCESLYSKEAVVAAIEEIFGKELHFDTCAQDIDTMGKIREKINEMIRAKI